MAESGLISREMYLERTNNLTKKVVVTYHLSWNPEGFLKCQLDEERKKMDKCLAEGKPADFEFIAVVDKAAYRAWRDIGKNR